MNTCWLLRRKGGSRGGESPRNTLLGKEPRTPPKVRPPKIPSNSSFRTTLSDLNVWSDQTPTMESPRNIEGVSPAAASQHAQAAWLTGIAVAV